MIDEPTTRRRFLRGLSTTGVLGIQASGGCLDNTDVDSALTQNPSESVTPTDTSTPTPTATPSIPDALALRDRPYTAMTPDATAVDHVGGYRVLATKPLRGRQVADRLGEAYDDLWTADRFGGLGVFATFAMQYPSGYYLRAPVSDDPLAEWQKKTATRLPPYRGFERYLTPAGSLTEVVAYADDTYLEVRNPYIDDFDAASRGVIDRAHGDGLNWHKTRAPYATLVEHLPQGLMTEVYPTGRQTRFREEFAFGQTVTLPEGSGRTAHVRTVIVFAPDADGKKDHLKRKLEAPELHRAPVRDPTVAWADHAAIVTDTCDVAEVLW